MTMIKAMIGLVAILIYIVLYISLIVLSNCGLFDTKYYRQQFRTTHYVRQIEKGKIWHMTSYKSELVEYKKKWWKLYEFEPLPDEWVFDSEETKKMWEKINEN